MRFSALLLILFLSINAIAGKVTIAGKILNPDTDSVKAMLYIQAADYILSEPQIFTVPLNRSGEFLLHLNISKICPVLLYNGQNRFSYCTFIQPGDSVYLFVNADTIKAYGPGAATFNLSHKLLMHLRGTGWTRPPTQFITYSDSMLQLRLAALDSFAETGKFSSGLKTAWKDQIKYEMANNKLNYPSAHNFFTSQGKNHQYLKMSQAYFDSIPRNLTPSKVSPGLDYYRYLLLANRQKLWALITAEKDSVKIASLKANGDRICAGFASRIESPLQKEYTYALLLKDVLYNKPCTPRNLVFLDSMVTLLKTSHRQSTDPGLYNTMLNAKNKWLSILGKPLPEITLADTTGKPVRLDALKGKVLLLDFWSTWCGPCLAGIPSDNALAERFRGKGFELVPICFDSEKKTWKSVIARYKYQGIHLWEDSSHRLYTLFNLKSFPSFALIDKQGRIRYYPAPRPDDRSKELDEMIEQLLKE